MYKMYTESNHIHWGIGGCRTLIVILNHSFRKNKIKTKTGHQPRKGGPESTGLAEGSTWVKQF